MVQFVRKNSFNERRKISDNIIDGKEWMEDRKGSATNGMVDGDVTTSENFIRMQAFSDGMFPITDRSYPI